MDNLHRSSAQGTSEEKSKHRRCYLSHCLDRHACVFPFYPDKIKPKLRHNFVDLGGCPSTENTDQRRDATRMGISDGLTGLVRRIAYAPWQQMPVRYYHWLALSIKQDWPQSRV